MASEALYGECGHAGVADAVLPRQAIGRRYPAHHLAGDLQKATLLLRGLVGRPRHLVEHLLEIDAGVGLEC